MVGIAPETLVPPTTVGRIGARVAEAAERWHRGIDDSGIGQAGREGIGVELRIMPRPRYRPHIDEPLDRIGREQRRETLDRQGRMADGEDRAPGRSEEHTSELQSLMRISYAVV